METDPTGAVLAATPTSGPASTLPAVLTVAILLLVLLTRIRGRELSPGRVLTLPLILVALGLGSTVPQLSTTRLHTIDAVVLAVDVLISLGLGGIRGFTVLLYPNGGRIWYRYGPLTVATSRQAFRYRQRIPGLAHHGNHDESRRIAMDPRIHNPGRAPG